MVIPIIIIFTNSGLISLDELHLKMLFEEGAVTIVSARKKTTPPPDWRDWVMPLGQVHRQSAIFG